jgi:hypothetical protein
MSGGLMLAEGRVTVTAVGQTMVSELMRAMNKSV